MKNDYRKDLFDLFKIAFGTALIAVGIGIVSFLLLGMKNYLKELFIHVGSTLIVYLFVYGGGILIGGLATLQSQRLERIEMIEFPHLMKPTTAIYISAMAILGLPLVTLLMFMLFGFSESMMWLFANLRSYFHVFLFIFVMGPAGLIYLLYVSALYIAYSDHALRIHRFLMRTRTVEWWDISQIVIQTDRSSVTFRTTHGKIRIWHKYFDADTVWLPFISATLDASARYHIPITNR